MDSSHPVSVQAAAARGLAAVHARLAAARVPTAFAAYLDQVYAAARAGAVVVDGQNIFLYAGDSDGEVEVEFGVGVAGPFRAAGPVHYTVTPAGPVATATHWGDYGRLGEAHAAVIAWCDTHGHALAGPRWEVYGHWRPDSEPPRTDVYYLLVE